MLTITMLALTFGMIVISVRFSAHELISTAGSISYYIFNKTVNLFTIKGIQYRIKIIRYRV